MNITLEVKTINFSNGVKAEYKLLFKNKSYTITAKLLENEKFDSYEEEVDDITTIEEKAKEIFDEIVKNKVSPCHLCEVIIDKICI